MTTTETVQEHKHSWVPHRVGYFEDFSNYSAWFVLRFTCGANDGECNEVKYDYCEAEDL